MPLTIPSEALRHMSEADRAQLLEAAFAVSPAAVANYLLVLDARLRTFEQRYELPSHGVADALRRGELRDTKDVSEWLFWVDVRSRLAGEARP